MLLQHRDSVLRPYNELINVGTRCKAKRNSGICKRGEIGVCYEVYTRSNTDPYDLGFSFIFYNGGYDGWSTTDIDAGLLIIPGIVPSLADYNFANVSQLRIDFQRGVFSDAWEQ